MNMDISVILPTYNRAELLREALVSVVNQRGVQVEAIVVDDGSTEDVRTVAESFGSAVVYVRQENAGACAARNNGFGRTRGEFVKFLDSDDYLAEGALVAQVTKLRGTGADVCYGRWDEVGVEAKNPSLPPYEMPLDDAVDSLLADWWTPNFSYTIRREFAQRAAWDSKLTSAQDFDYALSLAINGGRFVHVDAMIGYYRFHGNARTSRRKISEWCGNREYALTKAWRQLVEGSGLTPQRRHYLALGLFRLSQVVFAFDRVWYRRLIANVRELEPAFAPPKRAHAMAARLLGFEGAEKLLHLRRSLRKGSPAS